MKQNSRQNNSYQNEMFTFENFLLVHTVSKQAFINLSKRKDAFSKEELLNEIKRLVIEQVREQMREKVLA